MKLYLISHKKRTVLVQVLIYFILIIFITLIATSSILYNFFSTSFKDEITKFNNRMLDQLSAFSDEFILKNINELALNLAMYDNKNIDFKNFFIGQDPNDWKSILNTKYILDDLLFQNREIVDSIYAYSKSKGLCVSPQRIKYIDEDMSELPDEYNWINTISQSGSSSLWLKTRKTKVHSMLFDEQGDIITILCTYPISSSPETAKGYIAVNIKEEAINKYLVIFNASKLGQLLVIDETGSIISHSDKTKLYTDVSKETFVQKILSIDDQSNFKATYEGTEYVVSHVQSKYNRWHYITMIPIKLLYQKNYFIRQRILIVCTIVLLFVLILSTMFSRRIYSPLRKLLDKHATTLYSGIPAKSANEYQILDSLFDNMSGKINDLQDTLNQNMSMIQHNFLNELLNKKVIDISEVEDTLRSLGIKFPFKFFTAAVFKLPKEILQKEEQTKIQFFRYQLISIMNSLNNSNYCVYPVDTDRSTISVIINFSYKDLNKIKQFIDEVEVNCYTQFSFYPIAGVGRLVDSLPGIHKSNISAKMAIQYKFMRPAQNTFYFDEIVYQNINAEDIPSEYHERFEKYLKLTDFEGINTLFNDLQTYILENAVPYHLVRKKMLVLNKIFTQYLDDVGLNSEDAASKDIKKELLSPENIYEYFKLFSIEVKKYFDQLIIKRNNKNSELISSVEQYIVNHLESDLSLDSTAAAFRISSQYLSKIFKEEKKINFIDYVVSCKIEKSKELLLLSNLTIEQISNRIGYNHAAYFARKFKESTGITPSQFRQRESQKQIINSFDN